MSRNFTLKEMLNAIEGSMGLLTIIQKKLKSDYITTQKYLKKYPECEIAIKAEKEKILDKAESVIINAMNEEDIRTAKWYLTLKGRDRGYIQNKQPDIIANQTEDNKIEIKFINNDN